VSGFDWSAVGAEVRKRMTEREVTVTELSRLTALSETTVQQIRKGHGNHRGYALVALSAALGWPPQYLRGQGQRKAGIGPGPE
jgi:hypothetical protein